MNTPGKTNRNKPFLWLATRSRTRWSTVVPTPFFNTKALFLLAVALLSPIFTAASQTTYLYKCIKRVHTNGSTEKMEHTRYFTFSENMMFESDKDGLPKVYPCSTFKYKGQSEGKDIYMLYTYPVVGLNGSVVADGWNRRYYYLVSPDKSTINDVCVMCNFTTVYVRITDK